MCSDAGTLGDQWFESLVEPAHGHHVLGEGAQRNAGADALGGAPMLQLRAERPDVAEQARAWFSVVSRPVRLFSRSEWNPCSTTRGMYRSRSPSGEPTISISSTS